jgi:hypothetical protein
VTTLASDSPLIHWAGIPVDIKIYGSMSTTSADTKRHAEDRVGKTDKYWDTKMADAVNAAWWGARH